MFFGEGRDVRRGFRNLLLDGRAHRGAYRGVDVHGVLRHRVLGELGARELGPRGVHLVVDVFSLYTGVMRSERRVVEASPRGLRSLRRDDHAVHLRLDAGPVHGGFPPAARAAGVVLNRGEIGKVRGDELAERHQPLLAILDDAPVIQRRLGHLRG